MWKIKIQVIPLKWVSMGVASLLMIPLAQIPVWWTPAPSVSSMKKQGIEAGKLPDIEDLIDQKKIAKKDGNQTKIGNMISGSFKSGWHQEEDGWHYRMSGADLTRTLAVLDGKLYRFDENGVMMTGIVDLGGQLYAIDVDGNMLPHMMVRKDGQLYLTGASGEILTGYQWIGTDQYYFTENGMAQAGGVTPDGLYNLNLDGKIVSINLYIEKGKCPLEGAPGTSGYEIGGYPVELFLLSIAGETSGGSITMGDHGRAYGLCQFDYRYDLMDFVNYAYQLHPALWSGFADFSGKHGDSDETLVGNSRLEQAFQYADAISPTNYAADQISFLYRRYFISTYRALEEAGFHLEQRNIAVSSALLSVNINCGVHNSLYLRFLSPKMTDDEMITEIYRLRNTVLTRNGKGTNTRYLHSEPELARQLLNGEVNARSTVRMAGGVSWSADVLRYCGEVLSDTAIEQRLAVLGPGFRTAQTENKETAGFFNGISWDQSEFGSIGDAEGETKAQTSQVQESSSSPVYLAGQSSTRKQEEAKTSSQNNSAKTSTEDFEDSGTDQKENSRDLTGEANEDAGNRMTSKEESSSSTVITAGTKRADPEDQTESDVEGEMK